MKVWRGADDWDVMVRYPGCPGQQKSLGVRGLWLPVPCVQNRHLVVSRRILLLIDESWSRNFSANLPRAFWYKGDLLGVNWLAWSFGVATDSGGEEDYLTKTQVYAKVKAASRRAPTPLPGAEAVEEDPSTGTKRQNGPANAANPVTILR